MFFKIRFVSIKLFFEIKFFCGSNGFVVTIPVQFKIINVDLGWLDNTFFTKSKLFTS